MDIQTAGQIIVWIIIGGLAGAVAGMIVRGRRRGFGVIGNIVVGLIGAVIGGIIFDYFNLSVASQIQFDGDDLISAIVGSLILLLVLFLIRR